MLGTINDQRAAMEIGSIFGSASQEVRTLANESLSAQERGERPVREDSFTDRVVSEMRGAMAGRLAEIAEQLSDRGVTARIEFTPTNLPAAEEEQYGADIGIRATLHTPSAVIIKGVLIQCKKMSRARGKDSYLELRGRGERQARDMLGITPASFFLLFNHGQQSDLLNYSLLPLGILCPHDDGGPIPESKRERIGDACPYWQRSDGGLWDLGIAVLPATRVLASSVGSAASGKPFPVDAARILRGCLPLGVFIVDLFASCFVGDPREEVVRIVTPPRLRDSLVGTAGLPADPFRGFAVRHYLSIELAARE